MIHSTEESAINISLSVLIFQFDDIGMVGDNELLKVLWSGKCQCLFPEVALLLFGIGLSEDSRRNSDT